MPTDADLYDTLKYRVVVEPDGTRRYRLNGVLHRQLGPAVIFENGTEIWYQRGERHRLGGPAVTMNTGEQHWYLSGCILLEREYWRILE